MKKLFLLPFIFLFNSINAQVDIGITEIVSPQGVIDLYSPAVVKVWVKNFGSQTIDSIPIVLSLNNSIIKYDTIIIQNGIQAGDSSLIETDITYNVPIGAHQICVSSYLANDTILMNNEVCTCVYGSYNGQENDLSILDIRPTINHPGAGTYELFDLLIKNTGKKPVDTIQLKMFSDKSIYTLPWAIAVNDTLFPDSSKWLHANIYFNRYVGQNEANFVINDPSDVLACNDTITYIYWGQRRSFDLSIDSFYCQPTIGDTLLSDSIDLIIYYTNQGTQPINQIFTFVSYEHMNPFDTIVKNINLQPLQSDSINVQGSFTPQFISEAEIGVWFLELDSNSFNDGYRKIYFLLHTAISDINNPEKIEVYPNPTKGILYIGSENNSHKIDIEIFNIQGVNVLSANNVNKIDLKNLPEGIYFLRIELDGKIDTYKIIKI